MKYTLTTRHYSLIPAWFLVCLYSCGLLRLNQLNNNSIRPSVNHKLIQGLDVHSSDFFMLNCFIQNTIRNNTRSSGWCWHWGVYRDQGTWNENHNKRCPTSSLNMKINKWIQISQTVYGRNHESDTSVRCCFVSLLLKMSFTCFGTFGQIFEWYLIL